MSFFSRYTKINQSFDKTLVFKIGACSGFYSELNGMIFTMLYCLDKGIQFKLTSQGANFADKKGWNEFFLPFTDEDNDTFHHQYNMRFVSSETKEFLNDNKKLIQAYKKEKGIDYLTCDIFSHVHNKLPFVGKEFYIKELALKGGSFEASKKLAKMVYRFNDETNQSIDTLIESLNLPKDYVAIHIRGGDIKQEIHFRKQHLLEADAYIEKIEELQPHVKNLFVFTDEYRHVLNIKAKRPDWNIYTLCGEHEDGFHCEDFLKQSWGVRKEGQIKLFANVRICKRAMCFVGTYTSNPDWFLYLMMDKQKFHCVDCEQIEWQVLRNKRGTLSKYHNVDTTEKSPGVLKKFLNSFPFNSDEPPKSPQKG